MTLAMQKYLLSDLKKELCANINLLIKLEPMSLEISNIILKENGLEKLSRHIFNELSYYLVSIIDSHVAASFPWPLYDSKIEKQYRNKLCNYINNYNNTSLLSPVISSYMVNPGCFKVIMLLYQMSTVALQKLLLKKMPTNRQKTLYTNVTQKYKANNDNLFVEDVSRETDKILCKLYKYLHKQKTLMHIGEILRNKIVEMERTLSSCNPQDYIDSITDKFIKNHTLDDGIKTEIVKIKDVSNPCYILNTWLTYLDFQLEDMENKWKDKMEPFLKLCQSTQICTQELISRHIGETDRNLYIIEYNPKADEICTKQLQSHVNMEQKYVLKNIVKEGKLSFPYLIRGYLVAICYILKDAEIDDDIYKFNEYLKNGKNNYSKLVSAMGEIIERVNNAELVLQLSSVTLSESYQPKDNTSAPPMPDLTDIKSNRNVNHLITFDSITPLSMSKHQYNLFRKRKTSIIGPQRMLTKSFHQFLRDDKMKSLKTRRVSSYNCQNISQNFHNMSIVPQINRINETISECTTGFTKLQIERLLSTIKKGSKRCKTEIPKRNNKKINFFNESSILNENTALVRCSSSPNLIEHRVKHPISKMATKRLSIMQEHLEISGIVLLESESPSGCSSQSLGHSARVNATSLPSIIVTREPENLTNNISNDRKGNIKSGISLMNGEDIKAETPKNNIQLSKKTNSLEKIINRFKKIKGNNVLSTDVKEHSDHINVQSKLFRSIVEEKETKDTITAGAFNSNRNLLPDLLSPNFNGLSQRSIDYLDQICFNLDETVRKKPRESLGTALGVDQTFLDQFDLID